MNILKAVIFIFASVWIMWVSRAALKDPRSHGFYRFFAWEAILLLVLLNLNYWFVQPLAWHQLIAWTLLFISLYIVIEGFRLLRRGKSGESRRDDSLLEMEKTTELVTSGLYAYIRHPLYSSLLFLTWGTFFKHPNLTGFFLALLATVALALTAKVEEFENLQYFGDDYRVYRQRTKKFIPFFF
ncbi:MAG: isoprenylcysteine carboxylmethyltransferase family protein [Chloroflexi bacterium]|jgi:protein-S-isoprenylcysteine O-methyltransferase Ste14|nr:isoprenylcysteine carboxylmethyltransferase family protein [Chloroflexota bacterium]